MTDRPTPVSLFEFDRSILLFSSEHDVDDVRPRWCISLHLPSQRRHHSCRNILKWVVLIIVFVYYGIDSPWNATLRVSQSVLVSKSVLKLIPQKHQIDDVEVLFLPPKDVDKACGILFFGAWLFSFSYGLV